MHREERADKGRHSMTAAGSTAGVSSMQQQKPPRFQNQQRYQQQQQVINESLYGHQNWSSSYNDSNYGGTWPGQDSTPSSSRAPKSRDDFGAPSHQESYGTVSYNDRNKSTRQQQMGNGGYRNSFDASLDLQTNHGLGGQYDGVGDVQNFGQQQDISFNSATKFSSQHSASLLHDTFSSYSRTQNHQSNQMYTMDFAYKETSPNSLSNSHSMSNNINSSPPYGSTAYSSNTSYGGIVSSDGSPSNQYIPDSKSWQWHKGDKCMAKYWEDNMVSFVILILHAVYFSMMTVLKTTVEQGPS